jgi:glycolate oxidase iron-sulfur subunit
MVWQTLWAPTAADVERCISCGLCLPVCPTFRLTGDETASPRGRLLAMAAVADGVVPLDETFAGIMDLCLQCRACEAACPALVPFGRAMTGARSELAETGYAPKWRSRVFGRWIVSLGIMRAATFGLALLQRLGARFWLRGRWHNVAGLRRVPFFGRRVRGLDLPAHGEEIGTAALLAGCVAEPWFGSLHRATIELLRRAGYRVVVPATQTCCGALAAHEGAAAEAADMAARNVEAFREADVIVANVAGCSAHLKEYGDWAGEDGAELAARVRDITEVVAEAIRVGRLPRLVSAAGRVAMQDPCHLRQAQRILDEPRLIMEAAGYEVVEIDPDGLCCGAAGAWAVAHAKESKALGRRIADLVRSSGVDVVASANAGCEMQLRAHLGRRFRVAHPVELYAERL